MKQILNTLFVMTQGAYVSLDHETLKVEVDGKFVLQVPLHHLGGVVTFGNVMMSPFLMGRCAEDGRAVTILDWNGRFRCRVVGKVSGNVLLRQAQHEVVRDRSLAAGIARTVVAGKVKNCRQELLRSTRDNEDEGDAAPLHGAAVVLASVLHRVKESADLDVIRGLEGEAANIYFGVFNTMVKPEHRGKFSMNGRSRRPPLDRMNGLLSFLYTLLLHDCISAAEGVGLDPQMGFMHALRPGKPSLALDLMEELRPVLADRLALTLVNRQQLAEDDFDLREGGATFLNEKGRKTVVTAWQKRKQEEIRHHIIQEQVPYGLIAHVQARLLARHLRGDLEAYPPFIHA